MDLGTAMGLTGVGGILTGYMNMRAQQQANERAEANAWEMFKQEKDLANTAHQRSMQDKLKAGINPIYDSGGGAGSPGGSPPPITAPKIELPDLMSYGISLKQIEQKDAEIAINNKLASANIAKNLTEQDLNKMKKIMLQKGMIRAELEGEASSVLKNILRYMKDSVRKPKQPGQGGFDATDRLQNDFPGMGLGGDLP